MFSSLIYHNWYKEYLFGYIQNNSILLFFIEAIIDCLYKLTPVQYYVYLSKV